MIRRDELTPHGVIRSAVILSDEDYVDLQEDRWAPTARVLSPEEDDGGSSTSSASDGVFATKRLATNQRYVMTIYRVLLTRNPAFYDHSDPGNVRDLGWSEIDAMGLAAAAEFVYQEDFATVGEIPAELAISEQVAGGSSREESREADCSGLGAAIGKMVFGSLWEGSFVLGGAVEQKEREELSIVSGSVIPETGRTTATVAGEEESCSTIGARGRRRRSMRAVSERAPAVLESIRERSVVSSDSDHSVTPKKLVAKPQQSMLLRTQSVPAVNRADGGIVGVISSSSRAVPSDRIAVVPTPARSSTVTLMTTGAGRRHGKRQLEVTYELAVAKNLPRVLLQAGVFQRPDLWALHAMAAISGILRSPYDPLQSRSHSKNRRAVLSALSLARSLQDATNNLVCLTECGHLQAAEDVADLMMGKCSWVPPSRRGPGSCSAGKVEDEEVNRQEHPASAAASSLNEERAEKIGSADDPDRPVRCPHCAHVNARRSVLRIRREWAKLLFGSASGIRRTASALWVGGTPVLEREIFHKDLTASDLLEYSLMSRFAEVGIGGLSRR